MSALDFELSTRIDSLTGLPKEGMEEEVSDIVRQDVWPAFFATPIGQEMQSKYEWSQSLSDTIRSEFARRFGVAGKVKGGVPWPGAFFLDRITEVCGDLVRTKHPCLVPKIKPAAPTQPTAEQNFDALKDRVRADIENPAVSSRDIEAKKRDPQYKAAFDAVQIEAVNKGYGVNPNAPAKPEPSAEVSRFAFLFNDHYMVHGTPKCYGGYFTLQTDGKRYEYPKTKFDALMNQAIDAGLIR